MKANTIIEPDLLNNGDAFTHPFFKQFALQRDKQPLRLNDDIKKDYRFPTLYGDATCAIAVFLCDYEKAQAMLPHSKMKPVRMPRGRALVTFSCYEYKNVLNLAPYNEIAMTIPVMVDPAFNVPVLPMIVDGFKKFGYHVFHMPVTSLENRIRGNNIWGLPKVLDDIDIAVNDGYSETKATDELGNEYFRLRVPTQGKAQEFDVKSNLYSRLNDELLQSPTAFKASFNMNKFMDRLWKKENQPNGTYLKIGDGPYGDLLRSLDIESQPFQFRYAHHMNACFDLPNRDYKAPSSFSDNEIEGATHHA